MRKKGSIGKKSNFFSEWKKDPEYAKYSKQEALSQAIILDICTAMYNRGVNRKQLAKELGITKRKLSSIFSGKKDLTLHLLSSISSILDVKIEIAIKG